MGKLVTLWVLAVISTACSAHPPAAIAPDESDLGSRIESVVSPYVRAGDFMGVIGIGKDGEPALILPFGQASVELEVPHTSESVFMIGSVSKQFTAVAILLLEEDGRLSTSDKVSVHLPDFPHGEKITIDQLLTHTAGIVDVYSLDSFGATQGQSGTFEAVIEEIGQWPLTSTPGSIFQYSNGGYSLLAAIIEAAAEADYGDFLHARIFAPLGMRSASHDQPRPAMPDHVPGYDPWGTDLLAPATKISPAFLKGSGSLWASAMDLLKWSEGLHSGKLLRPDSYRKFITADKSSYAYGVSVFTRFGRKTIGHDGRVSGYASDLARYVDAVTTVVILSNVQSVSRDSIRSQVAAAVFAEEYPIPDEREFAAPPVGLGDYTGAYDFGPGFTVFVEERDGRLMAAANRGGWSELIPLANGMWFSRMLYATVHFQRADSGMVTRLIWGSGEGAPSGKRLD